MVKDCNHISNEEPHVSDNDWKMMNVAKYSEDPKYIKMDKQFTEKEVEDINFLVRECWDVFAW